VDGRRFIPSYDEHWMTHAVDESLWKGNPEYTIFNIPYSDYPSMVASAVGGVDFSNAASPQMTLTTREFPDACMLDFFLQCFNYVRVTVVGNQCGAEVVQPL